MNKVEQDELYQHLSGFLKTKGIELQEGSYTQKLRRGCTLLAKTINTAQKALGKAKTTVDAKLEQVRQTIHEKTAPKPAATAPAASPPAPTPPAPATPAPPAAAPKTSAKTAAKKPAPRKPQPTPSKRTKR